jgi:NAD(P)-dependent dehydrogenase (short-subunit alcohol dehydrogenase family)
VNNDQFSLSGKRALIVGADSGIGLACARAIAAGGARLVISGLSQVKGDRLALEIAGETGADVSYVEVDVREEARVAAAVKEAASRLGGLDVVMNNAGIPGPAARMNDYPSDEFDALFAINVRGTFLSMKHEIPYLLATGKGSIINVASTAALVGLPFVAPYSASKHAIVGLTKSAALELAPNNIRVNAIAPGPVETGLLHTMRANRAAAGCVTAANVPLGRSAAPQEMAGAVAWLASDAASFVTGAIISIDGGVIAQ